MRLEGIQCNELEIPTLRTQVTNPTLVKALVALVPAGILFAGSVLLFLCASNKTLTPRQLRLRVRSPTLRS